MKSQSNRRHALFCAADGFYAMQMAVMLHTCCKNYSGEMPLAVFIVDGGLTQLQRKMVEDSIDDSTFQLHWRACEDFNTDHFFVSNHITVATYYRLLLPKIVPAEYDRVVYLDVDTAILADVNELFDSDLGEHFVLARKQAAPPSWRFSDRDHYFNAGVMVIDLPRWREFEISERSLVFASEKGRLNTEWDQGALNVMLEGKWGELPWAWNAEPNAALCGALTQDNLNGTKIIHYLGVSKPWYTDYPFSELQSHYFQMLDETEWRGWRPKRGMEAGIRRLASMPVIRTVLQKSAKIRSMVGLNYSNIFRFFRTR